MAVTTGMISVLSEVALIAVYVLTSQYFGAAYTDGVTDLILRWTQSVALFVTG
jgi:hypothetical protein